MKENANMKKNPAMKEDSKEKIADELSDILFMVVRVADHYKINLEKEHLNQIEIARKHPAMRASKRA